MKIPKTFVLGDKKEINPNKIEIPITSLEDLIPKSINGMRCEEKIVTGLINSYHRYNSLYDLNFNRIARDFPLINRMALAKYDNGDKKIVLMEYKKQHDLINSLTEISEYIDTYHMIDRRDFLKKRLLSKDNILVWLDGDNCFIESVAFHYKSLGFEQFS